jgi:murein DD-endopeptidase MepM/ murein hydrolase activator NlpD
MLVRLNHLTTPAELYAGVNLVIPQTSEEPNPFQRGMVSNGMSMLEYAILGGTSPWIVREQNNLQGNWDILAGETYYLPTVVDQPSVLPVSPLDKISISPLPLVQGKTTVVEIEDLSNATYGGSLTGHELIFSKTDENSVVSLQGIHAMQEPGIYPFRLTATIQDGTKVMAEKMVIIQDGFYSQDPRLIVDYSFIDPAVTIPENEWLTNLTSVYTPEKYWDGLWISPSPFSYRECINSKYGNRRAYNDGPFENFHTGLDFCGGEGTQIFAPAAGVVVFAGEKTVRGNATIIDHGRGIFTGYWHQSQINVQTGDVVEPGDVIGLVGATGRVTGAHLHFEIWVGGVQVQPLDWLENIYP